MQQINNKLRIKKIDKDSAFFDKYIKEYENYDTYFDVRSIFQKMNPIQTDQFSPSLQDNVLPKVSDQLKSLQTSAMAKTQRNETAYKLNKPTVNNNVVYSDSDSD